MAWIQPVGNRTKTDQPAVNESHHPELFIVLPSCKLITVFYSSPGSMYMKVNEAGVPRDDEGFQDGSWVVPG